MFPSTGRVRNISQQQIKNIDATWNCVFCFYVCVTTARDYIVRLLRPFPVGDASGQRPPCFASGVPAENANGHSDATAILEHRLRCAFAQICMRTLFSTFGAINLEPHTISHAWKSANSTFVFIVEAEPTIILANF